MIRIIAIGSPFLDDDISFRVMDEIKPTLLQKYPAIDICYLDRPGMQLVNELQNIDCAILIDALVANQTPGKLIRLKEDDLAINSKALSSHDLSVAEAIKLARQLAVLPEQLFIIGINIQQEKALTSNQLNQCSQSLLAELDSLCSQIH